MSSTTVDTERTPKNIDVGPAPALIPLIPPFKAELCGSDEENYIYIRNCDERTSSDYVKLCATLDFERSGVLRKPLEEQDIVPEALVVVKVDQHQFYRARVKEKNDIGLITCFKLDEGLSVTVLAKQIYPMTESDLMIPCITIKCRLEGMQIFDGLPHLEMAYKLLKMGELENVFYDVEVKELTDGIPTVVLTKGDQSIASLIQKFIPKLCEVPLPRPGRMNEAHILHANSKGLVWLRYMKTEGLLGNIEVTLEELRSSENLYNQRQYSTLFSAPDTKNDDYLVVKNQYPWKNCQKLVGRMFIILSQEDQHFYRVRVLRVLKRSESLEVEIEFIDYGNKIFINGQYLIPVEQVDENLEFIPPQVLTARMYGFYRMEEKLFWELCPNIATVVVRDSHWEESDRAPEVEIYKPDDLSTSINELWIKCPEMHYNSDINSDAVIAYMGKSAVPFLQSLDSVPKNGLRKFPSYIKDETVPLIN